MKQLTICIVFFCFTVPVVHADFLDTVNHPHRAEIQILQSKKIVQGYGYGIFRPDILINRAEFLKIILTARYGREANDTNATQCFTDFIGKTEWYWGYACKAKKLGIISGYADGSFKGAQTINLAESLKIISETFAVPIERSLLTPTLWYVPYFTVADTHSLFNFFPRNGAYLMTRSDMAYAIVHMEVELIDAGEIPVLSSSVSSIPQFYNYLTASQCGNYLIEMGETCDDGNTFSGDGCSAICLLETSAVPNSSASLASSSNEPLANLFISKGDGVIPDHQIAIGLESVPLYAFEIFADAQDVTLQKLLFAVSTTAGTYTLRNTMTNTSYELVRIGTNGAVAITNDIVIKKNTPQTFVVTFTPASTIAVNTAVTVTLKANEVRAVQSATLTELRLNDGNTVAEGEIFVGTAVPANNSEWTSSSYTVMNAIWTHIENATSAEASLVKNVLPIATMRMAAATGSSSVTTAKSLFVTKFIFTIEEENISVYEAGFSLYNVAKRTKKIACTTSVAAKRTVVCDVPPNQKDVFAVTGEAPVTFILEGIVLNTAKSANKSSLLQASLQSLGTSTTPGDITYTDGTNTYTWIDVTAPVNFTRFK